MEEQTTEEVTIEEVTEEVQPVSTDDLLGNVADAIFEETDQPEAEVKEPETKPVEEKPDIHTVKVDGEEQEIDYSELLKGYQTAKHNTQTAQQLADNQRELAPVIGLAKRLTDDPKFAEHVFGYGKEPEQELDPIEQIKADAVKAAEAKVEKRFEEQTAETQQVQINTLRDKVMQDPLYDKVQGALHNYVKSMPASMQETMMATLDRDPQAYAQMYQKARATIAPETKEPVKKTKPPVLVEAGLTEEVPVNAARKQQLNKKRAEILKSGDHDALEDYFMMDGGVVDSLGL